MHTLSLELVFCLVKLEVCHLSLAKKLVFVVSEWQMVWRWFYL